LDLEVFQEDLDRMRQTHWIRTAYSLGDAAKLGALLDIQPFSWEHIDLYANDCSLWLCALERFARKE